jgi:hypothetical protein
VNAGSDDVIGRLAESGSIRHFDDGSRAAAQQLAGEARQLASWSAGQGVRPGGRIGAGDLTGHAERSAAR